MSRAITTVETALIVLVIIAIVLSAGTLGYVMGLTGLVGVPAKVDELSGTMSSSMAELVAAERELAGVVADLGEAVGAYAERIAAIEERLSGMEERIAEVEKARPLRIGYISQAAYPYWIIFEEGVKVGAEKYGVDALVWHPPEPVIEPQIKTLRAWAAMGFDAIVIAPNDIKALDDTINEVLEMGIPIFTSEVDAPGSNRLCFISFDWYHLGVVGAEALMELLEEKGYGPDKPAKVLWAVGFIETTEVIESLEGFKDTVEGTWIDFKEEEILLDEGSPAKAYELAMEAMAKYPDLAGVWAYWDYDGPAWGAAVTAAGKIDEVVVLADSLTGDMVPYFETGAIDGTTEILEYERGIISGELAARLALAGKDPAAWEDVIREYIPNWPEEKIYKQTGAYLIKGAEGLKEYAEKFPDVYRIIVG